MFCFPVVEDYQGFIRLGNPVTVSQKLHHGQILHALKIGGVPSDSYICSERLIDKNALDKPEKQYKKSIWARGG
jgi:hypothetical protein